MDFFGITPSSQHISPLLLTCYICKRIYTRPKILSCYHTFCEACLLKSFPSQGLSLHCVICGHQSVLPKGGVGELEANPYVERIMKRVTEDTRPVTDTQRSNIPDVSELHANLAMETTVAADNRNTINETNIAFRCSLRCNNPVAMYCKSCDMVVCDNCAKIEHVEHFEKIITLEVMSKECEESLLKQAHTLERKMSPLHETSTEINRVTAELVSNRDTAIQTVNAAFDELESTLSRRRGELLQKIESTFAEKHSLLKSQTDELKSFTDKMEEGLDVIIQSMSCEDESFDSDMKTMNEGSDRIPDTAAFFLHKQISRTIDDLSKYKTENFEEELKKEVCGTVHSSDHGSNHIVEEIPDKFTIPCENSHIALENLQNVNKIRHMISTVGTVETSAAVAQKSVISGECLTTGVCKIDHENTILLTAKTSSGELETSGKVLATVDVKCLGPIPDNVVCSSPSDSSNSSGKRLLKSSRRPQSGVRLSTPSPGFKTTPTRRDTPSSPGSTLNRSPLKDIFFYTHAENSQPGGEREQTVVTEPTVTIDYIKHGTYEVTFIPRVEGQYKLSVKLYGQDIPQGSFLVSAVHKHGGMRVRSPSKSDKVILRPQSVRQKGMKRPPSIGPSKNPIEDDLVQRVGGRGRGKGEFSNPQGLALDNLGRLLVADSTNQCIQVFSITGRKREPKYLFKFGERGRGSGQVQRPTGVYVLPNGDIAVSDYDNKVVKIFGEDGTSKSIIGNGKLMGPKGLCVNRNGHLVVVDNKLCQIFLFQMNGKLVTKFGSRGTEPHQLAGPHFVSVNSENSIYVSDFYNHCVKVFTPRGDFLSVIGSSGEGCGQFNAPTGLAIDSRGNMIVADWGNSRLQVFDKFGSFLSYINTDEDPLYGPQGVTLTQDEKVAVADSGNHCVKIYRYLQ